MAVTTYTLEHFVEDLRVITTQTQNEQSVIERVAPLAQRLALAKDEWLEAQHYTCDEEQGFRVHLLHEEPDHTLAVFAISWLPHRGAPPHNHGTWAVVAGVDGPEKNIFWKRLDDGTRPGYADIQWNGEKIFCPGDTVCFVSDEIHSVVNDSEEITVSLHVYGKHLNYTGRSQFHPETKIAREFLVK